jgi:hypothetical protein
MNQRIGESAKWRIGRATDEQKQRISGVLVADSLICCFIALPIR